MYASFTSNGEVSDSGAHPPYPSAPVTKQLTGKAFLHGTQFYWDPPAWGQGSFLIMPNKHRPSASQGEKQTLAHNAERKSAPSPGSCLGRGLQLTAGQVNPWKMQGKGVESLHRWLQWVFSNSEVTLAPPCIRPALPLPNPPGSTSASVSCSPALLSCHPPTIPDLHTRLRGPSRHLELGREGAVHLQ